MLTFFEKQIYFILAIIIIRYTYIKKIIIYREKTKFFLFVTSFVLDFLLNMRFGSSGAVWWFLIFYKNLNKQFFSILILYVFYLNQFTSIFFLFFNYLLINSFLYEN
jgi:hypothetical protein